MCYIYTPLSHSVNWPMNTRQMLQECMMNNRTYNIIWYIFIVGCNTVAFRHFCHLNIRNTWNLNDICHNIFARHFIVFYFTKLTGMKSFLSFWEGWVHNLFIIHVINFHVYKFWNKMPILLECARINNILKNQR